MINPVHFVYEIVHTGEPTAGFFAYTDEVSVQVDSGDPGGDLGEFEEHIRASLADWYDGATVRLLGKVTTK